MKRTTKLMMPALLVALLAGCNGGSDSGGSAATAPTKLLALTTPSPAASWTSVKWGGGGYVTGVIHHPGTANLVYARTDVGGAYRWNNSNSTWVPITDGIGFSGGESSFHGVESLALDPTNDQKVYMATGMSTADGNGRLYMSSDRGNSWSWVTLPFPVGGNNEGRAVGERLKVDPTNPSILFYGSRTAGLWKSSNSGQTWNQVTGLSSHVMGGAPIGVEHLMFDNSNVGGGQTTWIMYAAIAPDYANAAGLTSTLYKSQDGGWSWTPVPVPAAVSGYYIPKMIRTTDGNYYVVFNKNAGQGAQGPGYVYRFGGVVFNQTWTLLKSSTVGGFGGLAVHGNGSTARIAVGVTGTWGTNPGQVVQLSDNGGLTWREIAAGMPHAPAGNDYSGWIEDVEIDPFNRDRIMHSHGGGIWETTNASAASPSWNLKVNNLEETATLAVDTPPPGASYKLINSAGDIGNWVVTDLATRPTKGPMKFFSNGNSADMAWNDPSYIATTGVINTVEPHVGTGHWSGDSGNTWSTFATLPPGAAANTSQASNIAVTGRNKAIFAPADSVPYYTTNSGASWAATNLPALSPINGFPRSYRMKVDRKNPNKVYAYDSGGAWWGTPGKVYVSTNGGQSYTLSQGSVNANLRANPWGVTSMAVNPNAEGDIWLADGNAVYHSVDSGANWTKITDFDSVWGDRQTWQWPYVQGASVVALGKAAPGSSYSAAVYVVGVIGGKWGVYRSNDAGATWSRFNDDAHQYGGIHAMAGDWNTYGRLYLNGTGRGLIFTN